MPKISPIFLQYAAGVSNVTSKNKIEIHAQNFSDIAKLSPSFSWAEIALFPIQEGLPARPKKFILANLNHQGSSNLVPRKLKFGM